MGLTAEQVERYQEDGYLILEALIRGENRDRHMAVFHELVARGSAMTEPRGPYQLTLDEAGKPIPGRLHKIQGVGVEEARVLELVGEPEILDRVECLIGSKIDVFGTKFFPMLGP